MAASIPATSVESSNILKSLKWSDVEYRLDQFVDRFALPHIVKVQDDVNMPEIKKNSRIRAQQPLILHAVESAEKVLAFDRKNREIHLPLDCSRTIELRPPKFRGVCDTVGYLSDFKFVRVTQGYYSLDDESCTISPGDKLEVLGVEEGKGGREHCLVFQNQVHVTIRLPFSVSAGFQPLVDGREYSLKEASAKELPVYFQFTDPPDAIAHEQPSGMFNSSLGVLKFEKTYLDSVVICTALTGSATTVFVCPKLVSMKVLGALEEDDERHVKLCRVFHDRISLSRISDNELGNIHALRKTIRMYQECIEFVEFSLLAEKIGEDAAENSNSLTEEISPQEEVTKGPGDPVQVLDEAPAFPSSRQQQEEEEEISHSSCHDIRDINGVITPPQPSLTDEHRAPADRLSDRPNQTADTQTEFSESPGKVSSVRDQMPEKTKSADPVIRPTQQPACAGRKLEDSDKRGPTTSPGKKPKVPVKPWQGPPPVKPKPVLGEPPAHELSDTLETVPRPIPPPRKTRPPWRKKVSLPIVTQAASYHESNDAATVKERSPTMESETGHFELLGGVRKQAATNAAEQHTKPEPLGDRLSCPKERLASRSERDGAEESNRGAEVAEITTERKEPQDQLPRPRQQPPHTKPKPPTRMSSLPAEIQTSHHEIIHHGASERQPPPVKPKPVTSKRPSLPLN